MSRSFVIAVDGAAASGKGTLAGRLARHYALPYLDTGLLYRAVGRATPDLDDADAAAEAARRLTTESLDDPSLITAAAGEAASRVAAYPAVRAALFNLQRDFASQGGGAVLDGRDIGTVIAPHAPAKLYVDAGLQTRAERRFKQLIARGEDVSLPELIEDLRRRDARDAERADAPMTRAADAVLLDTTQMTIDAAFDEALRIVEQARSRWLGSSDHG
jgi:cytidylate kinase